MIILAALLLSAPPASATCIGSLPAMIERKVGSAELVVIDRARPMRVHYRLALRGGALDDPPKEGGLSRVAGELIAARARAFLAARSDGVKTEGCRFDVQVGDHSVAISGAVPADGVDLLLEALLGAVAAPVVERVALEGALRRARAPVLSESALLDHAVRRVLRPMKLSTTSSITAAGVASWLSARRADVVLGLVGPIEERTVSRAEALLHRLAGSTARRAVTARTPTPAARAAVIDRPGTAQATLVIARRLPAPMNPDALAAAEVLGELLSLGQPSRVQRMLSPSGDRSRGAATLVGEPDPAAFAIIVRLDADRAPQGASEILDHLREARTAVPSAEELPRAIEGALARRWRRLASPRGLLESVIGARLMGRPAVAIAESLERIAQVDPAALARAAQQLLADEDWQVLVFAEALPTLTGSLAALPGLETVEVWSGDLLSEAP